MIVSVLRALVLVLALLLLAGIVPDVGAAQSSPREYEVKAAFVYNILKFVEWPQDKVSRGNTIRLCILGRVPDATPFLALDGQDLSGKRLVVTHLTDRTELRECDVLFIAVSEERRLPQIMDALAGAPVLTLGDTEGFAQRGVVLNFYLVKDKVRFEINIEAARRSGFHISAKLLRLAGAVYGAAGAGE
jgi:hypothetical protein